MPIAKQKILSELSIETERLQLCSMCTEDAAFMYRLLNSAGWLKFIGDRHIHTIADASIYIDKLNHNDNIVYWKVNERNTGDTMGIITLVKRNFLTNVDIGFAFLPEYMGKGYALEATNAILKFLFENEIEVAVMAITDLDNEPSIKLLEKIGMKFLYQITENGEELFVYQINKK